MTDVQPQPQAMDCDDSDTDPLDVACFDIHDSLLIGRNDAMAMVFLNLI